MSQVVWKWSTGSAVHTSLLILGISEYSDQGDLLALYFPLCLEAGAIKSLERNRFPQLLRLDLAAESGAKAVPALSGRGNDTSLLWLHFRVWVVTAAEDSRASAWLEVCMLDLK